MVYNCTLKLQIFTKQNQTHFWILCRPIEKKFISNYLNEAIALAWKKTKSKKSISNQETNSNVQV